MSRALVLSLTILLSLLSLTACVSYRPVHVDPARAASRAAPAPTGPLAFEDAVRLLVDRSAELRHLRAEAAAVNLAPGPDPLRLSSQIQDGHVTETMIGTDLLSLLGIGPRQAEWALARAVRDERIRRHHERARALVAELAEAYAVDAVLRGWASPRPDFDVDAFREAGLASKASLAAADAAIAQADAEAAEIDTTLRNVRREILRLLGAAPGAPLEPIAVGSVWRPVPPATERRLLLARGDLLREQAAFAVADREFRLAVTRQWPNLGLALGGNVRAETPMQMIAIRLPLDAPAQARAMARARNAAARRFEEVVLDARHDAARARLELESAEARARGAAAGRQAAAALVRAATARIETEAETAFDQAVLAALQEVRAATAWRKAAVDLARARARAAFAAGWPTPREVGGLR